MPDNEAAAKPKGAPAETHNYRLATDPLGDHGYEVGFWPSGADMNDPAQYRVVAKCYSQAEAQALAASQDLHPPDHLPPEEGSHADDEENPKRTRTHHRASR
jgi:hypothetical protein